MRVILIVYSFMLESEPSYLKENQKSVVRFQSLSQLLLGQQVLGHDLICICICLRIEGEGSHALTLSLSRWLEPEQGWVGPRAGQQDTAAGLQWLLLCSVSVSIYPYLVPK